jgi:NADH dehydrogenase (ubiquinone) Fe-S protein 8
MSFARVGTTALRASTRPAFASLPSPLVLRAASLSSSAPRHLATPLDPQTGPTDLGRAPRHANTVEKARHQIELGTPDYSNGPSALDKAASLFFFTEIVRGASYHAL